MNSMNYIINQIIYWLIKIFNFPARIINFFLIAIYAIVIAMKHLNTIKEYGVEAYFPIIIDKMRIFVEKLIEFTRFPIPFIKDSPKVLYHHALMFWILLIWFLVR